MRIVRLLLCLLVATCTTGSLVASAAATAQDPEATPDSATPAFLFVQQATGGSLVPADGGAWTLTLTGALPQTIYFTDRPERLAGAVATAEFLALDGLFDAGNPPNAAVILAEPASDTEDVLIVELRSPAYDPAAATLIYTVVPIEGEQAGGVLAIERADASLPESFGHVSLFIDGVVVPSDDGPFCYPWFYCPP
jgi:hypothetical protein